MGFYFQESRHLIMWYSERSLVLFGGGTLGNGLILDVAGEFAISLHYHSKIWAW